MWSFVIGAVLGGIYILLAVMRVLSPPSTKLLVITDLLFTAAAALLNFLFALARTNGRIRGYVLAAELAAFLLLFLTVGKLLQKSAFVIRSLFCKMIGVITSPVRHFLCRLQDRFTKKCRNLLRKSKKN